MQQISVMIAKNLHFQVPCSRQVFFQEHGSIAKGRLRLALSFFELRIELRRVPHHAHPAASATHGRFHNDRVTHFFRNFLRFCRGLHRFFGPRQHRHSSR